MSMESCLNAWAKIGRDTTLVTVHTRRRATTILVAPIRYLSDDGICAIDVVLAPALTKEISSEFFISTYAKSIIDKCVVFSAKGGSIVGIGRFGSYCRERMLPSQALQ